MHPEHYYLLCILAMIKKCVGYARNNLCKTKSQSKRPNSPQNNENKYVHDTKKTVRLSGLGMSQMDPHLDTTYSSRSR